MKILLVLLVTILFTASCQTVSSKTEKVSTSQQITETTQSESDSDISEIRKIDFRYFTFPWTKTFGYGEKAFTLKNGKAKLADERELLLETVSYVDIVDGFAEQALVEVVIDDGNATNEMLYVLAVEKNQLKVLESFEFSDGNNIALGTAFAAHGELVIETYQQKLQDAECCPSVIEIANYRWIKDKFVLQGEPQEVLNPFVKRMKERNNQR